MMKSEWDPLKTKPDIKQRLNKLFGRFDQYTEAAKPKDSPESVTPTYDTSIELSHYVRPKEEDGAFNNGLNLHKNTKCHHKTEGRNNYINNSAGADLDEMIGQIVNVSTPLSPVMSVRIASSDEVKSDTPMQCSTVGDQLKNDSHLLEAQPECSKNLSSDLDVLLQHLTYVAPLISPIRSSYSPDTNSAKSLKRRATSPLQLDAVQKRPALTPLIVKNELRINGAAPYNLKMSKQFFHRLLQQQRQQLQQKAPEQCKKSPDKSSLNGSSSSRASVPDQWDDNDQSQRLTPNNSMAANNNTVSLEPLLPTTNSILMKEVVSNSSPANELQVEVGKNVHLNHLNKARDLKKTGDNERERVRQILLYFESAAFYIMAATSLASKPEKMYTSISDTHNFLNSSWTSFKNSKTVSSSTEASYIRNQLKAIQLLVSSCLAYHLYSIRSTRALSTYTILQRYEKENPQNLAIKKVQNGGASDGANLGTNTGAASTSPAASTPSSNRSNNSQQSTSTITLPADIYMNMSQQLRTLHQLMWSHKLWNDAKALLSSSSNANDIANKDGLANMFARLKHDADLSEVADFLLASIAWLRKICADRLLRPSNGN